MFSTTTASDSGQLQRDEPGNEEDEAEEEVGRPDASGEDGRVEDPKEADHQCDRDQRADYRDERCDDQAPHRDLQWADRVGTEIIHQIVEPEGQLIGDGLRRRFGVGDLSHKMRLDNC